MGVVITRPTSQEELVAYLSDNRFIVNTRVSRIMLQVDRKHFVSKDPYVDSSQIIPGSRYSVSAPNMHAAALELFKRHIFNGSRVLDVGAR
jgi:protein-L-isoaspartate(D-aspartate) O-methyltransferase